SLAELIDLLEELASYPPPHPPGSTFGLVEHHRVLQMDIFRGGTRERIDRIDGIDQLRLMCYRGDGRELDASYVRRIVADLADRLGLTLDQAKSRTVAEAVAHVRSQPASQPNRAASPNASPGGQNGPSAPPPSPPRGDGSAAVFASGTQASGLTEALHGAEQA